jgi:hypothetical protein
VAPPPAAAAAATVAAAVTLTTILPLKTGSIAVLQPSAAVLTTATTAPVVAEDVIQPSPFLPAVASATVAVGEEVIIEEEKTAGDEEEGKNEDNIIEKSEGYLLRGNHHLPLLIDLFSKLEGITNSYIPCLILMQFHTLTFISLQAQYKIKLQ